MANQAPIVPKSPREAIEPEPAAPPPPASRHARKQWVVVGNAIFSTILLVMVVLGGAFWFGRQAFVTPGPLVQDRTVFIQRGSTTEQIGETLERNGVVSSGFVFNAAVWLIGARGDLKWGEYLFPARISMAEALAIIIEGKAIQYQITLPEGLTSEQIVARLLANDILVGEVTRIPAEGSLAPDTYRFNRGETRQQQLDKMMRQQAKLKADIWAKKPADSPLRSADEMVTLASIVEKETGKAEERPRVAGVFINRLNRRMRLQSDPTIIYGLVGGKGTLGRPILRSEIEKLTPYNTYQIDGLPPTPIANPGRAAMEAVVNPARHRDVYFVADGTGGHAFAETLDQHRRNVERWRAIEREQADRSGGTIVTPSVIPAAPVTETPRQQ